MRPTKTNSLVRNTLFWLITALSLLGGSSCNESGLFFRKDEGVIIYDVSFPYESNSLLLELYPKEMVFEFKNDQFHTALKSSYGVVSTNLIIDNDEMTFVQMLKSFSDKSYIEMDEQGVERWLDQNPKVRLEETAETDSIAGYLCRKTIAYFLNDSMPPIELYSTEDIKIDGSNWWNQFGGVKGFLLGYEVEQYGKRMKLRAREVIFQPVQDDKFTVPSDYKKVEPEVMVGKIEELISDLPN